MNILCVGDVFLELESSTSLRENTALSVHIGGLTAKIAMELATLGLNVSFVGAVGDDYLGNLIIRIMRSKGVNTEEVVIKNARTSLLIKLSKYVKIFFRKPYFHTSDTELTLNDISLDNIVKYNALVSTSLSLTQNPLKHTVLYLAKHMFRNGKKTFLYLHEMSPYSLDSKELLNSLRNITNLIVDTGYIGVYGFSNAEAFVNEVFRKNPSTEEISLVQESKVIIYNREHRRKKTLPIGFGKIRGAVLYIKQKLERKDITS